MADAVRVLIVGAMDREIDGVRNALDCRARDPVLGAFPLWRTRGRDQAIGIVQTHVGDINAAIATTAAIQRCAPTCVLKLGCVGGHAEGVHTGDVVLPLTFFHSGAWITRDVDGNAPTADARAWQSVFGERPYQVNAENLGGREALAYPDAALTRAWAAHARRLGFSPVRAHIGASNLWFFDKAHMRHVLAAQVQDAAIAAWAADMESYAVAQACAVARVPFTGLYRVSNSEYYDEPYEPAHVAGLFAGAFIDAVAALARGLADGQAR